MTVPPRALAERLRERGSARGDAHADAEPVGGGLDLRAERELPDGDEDSFADP